jgi:hypothetical protein
MKNKMTAIYATLALMMMSFAMTANAQFGWPNNGGNNNGYGVSRFVWEGVVDGTTYVRIQRNRAATERVDGLPVQRQRFDFSDPLPRAAVNLDLNVLDGRGRVRLIDSPNSSNNFSAIVRIEDNSSGSDFYRFELRWNDRTRDDNYRDPVVNNGGVVWSGAVDGEVIVRFRGNNAWVEKVSGQGAWNDRFRFNAPLSSGVRAVNLDNVRGRGEIVIIEQPSQRNNFTACVLIRDRQSGASNYSFTLNWERNRYGFGRDDDRRDRDDDWNRRDGRDQDGVNDGRSWPRSRQ